MQVNLRDLTAPADEEGHFREACTLAFRAGFHISLCDDEFFSHRSTYRIWGISAFCILPLTSSLGTLEKKLAPFSVIED